MTAHIVEIKFKPEKDADDLVERLPFATEAAARDYATRKAGLPNIETAKYIGKG